MNIDTSAIDKLFELQTIKDINLVDAIHQIHLLFKNKQFDYFNDRYLTINTDGLAPEIMLLFTRTTFPARHLLKDWNPFVLKSKDSLDKAGLNGDKLLRGLL